MASDPSRYWYCDVYVLLNQLANFAELVRLLEVETSFGRMVEGRVSWDVRVPQAHQQLVTESFAALGVEARALDPGAFSDDDLVLWQQGLARIGLSPE